MRCTLRERIHDRPGLDSVIHDLRRSDPDQLDLADKSTYGEKFVRSVFLVGRFEGGDDDYAEQVRRAVASDRP